MKKLLRLRTMLLLCALIAGSGSVWADEYELVTSAPTDWTGDYVIVNECSSSASTWLTDGTVTGNSFSTASAVKTLTNAGITYNSTDKKLTGVTDSYVLHVSPSTNSGKYYITLKGANSTIYLIANSTTGSSSISTATVTTNAEWTLSLGTNGNAYLVGKSERYVGWNISYFRAYAASNKDTYKAYLFKKVEKPVAPTFDLTAGTYAGSRTLNISAAEGCTLKYTTDDTAPATSGSAISVNSNTAVVSVNASMMVRAIAVKNGVNSDETSAAYTITASSAASVPAFSKAAGEYAYGTTVELSSTNAVYIIYTTDESAPSYEPLNGTEYTGPIAITGDMTIKAIAVDDNEIETAVAQCSYTVTKPAAPIFSPVAGSYVGSQTVTISSPAGTTISYTTDGTDPSTSGTATLTDDNSASVNVTTTTTIRAITIDANAIESVETTASYTIVTPKTMPYSETFASSLNDFTVVADATLGDLWAINSSSAKASAYKNSAQNAGESWLVSPYITIAANAELSFEHADQYFNSENEMKSEATLWIREAGGDWQSLPINTYPEYTAKTKSDFASNATDLSAFAGKNVQIGFKYLGNTKSAGSWYVKNFKIEAVNPAPTFTLSSTAETLEMGSKETVDITLTTNTDGEISAASDDTDVATVALKSAGVYTITAKMEGTATITISAPETANFKAASQTVSVTVEDNREDAGIAFAEATQETTLGADYAGQALTNGNGVSPIAWTSTDETVATVSNGVVTVKAAGETTIKATYAGSATYKAAVAEYTLTVNKKAAAIEYAVSEATAKIGKAFAAPALANPNDLDVVYASSDESVATISSDGDVTIVAAGTTTISATFTEDAEYSGAVAQYTLTVVDPTNLTATFDFVNNNYGMEELSGSTQSYNSDPCEVSEGIVTMTLTGNTRCWITSSNPKTLELRFYKSSTFSVSVPDGYVITKIQLTGAESSNVSTEVGSYNNTVWTGSSQSVTFTSTHTSGNKALTAAVVSYKKTQEGVTIGDSKYATFCSDYALDFSGSDVKAYKAKVSENKVVLTRIENDIVPAGTGVILYCETADDYSIPVTTTEATVIDNELVGVTERTLVDWTTDGKYNHILQSGQFNNANGVYL